VKNGQHDAEHTAGASQNHEENPYIKWSEVARQAIWQRAKDLELLDKLAAKSTLMKDVDELER
jgi:hypothetical protein